MPLLFVVFAPAIIAILLAGLPKNRWSRWVIGVPSAIFVYLLAQIPLHHPVTITIPWVPSFGLSLSLFMDGLGLFFALIISGIGTLILLYASDYFDESGEYARFATFTLLFMSAMFGIVLSANLLLLFIFWEITSITSYLLIGFKHEKDAARDGARRALLITGGGGLALMAGVILLGFAGETFQLPELLASGNKVRESSLYAPALILILIGAFSKSAQWPLHFWLPGAMEAPTPASAYLHSATMVKAGIFLLARLSVILNGTDLWFYCLSIFGSITFLYGAIIALRQTDLKAILAYSTVSWLGALVVLQAPSTEEGAKALIVGILAHALYKGALFLVAGSVDHSTETRDITRLGKLASKMPFTSIGAIVAVLSMAGIPPLLGFLAKETLKISALSETVLPTGLMPTIAVIGSAFTVAVGLRLLWDTFFGHKSFDTPHPPHEVRPTMWIGPLALGIFSLGLPFFLAQAVEPLLNPALTAILGHETEIHLHLFEGINTPFILSMIAIATGIGLFVIRFPLIRWLQRNPEFNPDAIYRWLVNQVLPNTAHAVTSYLQNGYLRFYIGIILSLVMVLALGAVFVGNLHIVPNLALADFDWREVILCVLLIVGAITGVLANSRLSAITVLGIEGALVALTFALFGAPDLAFTQLMIEVISLVLFVLAFHFLPDTFVSQIPRIRKLRDIAFSIGVGATMTILILVAGTNPIAESISPWYIDNAQPIGQGSNVVNVILVDFRGLDTQGEIVVLIIAAMGVAALLHLRPSGQQRGRYIMSAQTQVFPNTDDLKQLSTTDQLNIEHKK